MELQTPVHFDLATAAADRWHAILPPRCYDRTTRRLELVLRHGDEARVVCIEGDEVKRGVIHAICRGRPTPLPAALVAPIRAALRLDEDLSLLYWLADRDPQLRWARASGAGRLLRAPSAYEDLIGAMVAGQIGRAAAATLLLRLCRLLGPSASADVYAFPSPAEMAAAPLSFYEQHAQAGRLSRPLLALSQRCRDELHADALRGGPLLFLRAPKAPTAAELGELSCAAEEWEERLESLLLSLPGFGLRGAELLLPLLGCYDAFLYSGRTLRGAAALPQAGALRRRLAGYGPFRGLALWLILQSSRQGRRADGSRSRKK